MKPDQMRHFGIMVRDEAQLAEVREKIAKKYGLKLIPGFRCDFRDPFGNRIQVADLRWLTSASQYRATNAQLSVIETVAEIVFQRRQRCEADLLEGRPNLALLF